MSKFNKNTEDEEANILAGHLPSGPCCDAKYQTGTDLRKLLLSVGLEFIKRTQSINELYDELELSTTDKLIAEFENDYGIQDTCLAEYGSTLEEKIEAIKIAIKSNGVSTKDQFESLAALLGLDVFVYAGNDYPSYTYKTEKHQRFTLVVDLANVLAASGFPYTFPFSFSESKAATLKCLFETIKAANVEIVYVNEGVYSLQLVVDNNIETNFLNTELDSLDSNQTTYSTASNQVVIDCNNEYKEILPNVPKIDGLCVEQKGIFDGSSSLNYGNFKEYKITNGLIVTIEICSPLSLGGTKVIASKYNSATSIGSWIIQSLFGKLLLFITEDGSLSGTAYKRYDLQTSIIEGDTIGIYFQDGVFKPLVNDNIDNNYIAVADFPVNSIYDSESGIVVGSVDNSGLFFEGSLRDFKMYSSGVLKLHDPMQDYFKNIVALPPYADFELGSSYTVNDAYEEETNAFKFEIELSNFESFAGSVNIAYAQSFLGLVWSVAMSSTGIVELEFKSGPYSKVFSSIDAFSQADKLGFSFSSGAVSLFKNDVEISTNIIINQEFDNVNDGSIIIYLAAAGYGRDPFYAGLNNLKYYTDINNNNNLVIDVPFIEDVKNKSDYDVDVENINVYIIDNSIPRNIGGVYRIGTGLLPEDENGLKLTSTGYKPADYSLENLYSGSDNTINLDDSNSVPFNDENGIIVAYSSTDEDSQIESVLAETIYNYSGWIYVERGDWNSYAVTIRNATGVNTEIIKQVDYVDISKGSGWFYADFSFTTPSGCTDIEVKNNEHTGPALGSELYYYCDPCLVLGESAPDRPIPAHKERYTVDNTTYTNPSTVVNLTNGTLLCEVNFESNDVNEFVFNINDVFYLKKNSANSLLLKINNELIALNLKGKVSSIKKIGVSWENGLTYRVAIDGVAYLESDYTAVVTDTLYLGTDTLLNNGLNNIKNVKLYSNALYINALKEATE